ncbi:MAG: sterol desaturase family protein [Chthoniobacter sp.]|nr:sterol desaturase family protein [Chthoniobacter sp.]
MHIDPLALSRIEKLMLFEYVSHFVRYALFAGGAYLVFYVWLRRRLIGRKIQDSFPKSAQMRMEVAYSLLSFLVFCGSGLLTAIFYRLGWSKLYMHIEPRGWLYMGVSLVAMIAIHDTWFYWTHRLMHWRPLFPIFHRVHHLSHNPTPWASFSFQPSEALVQAIIFPLAALVLPMHPIVALLWLFYMTVMNVFGHLGFEVLPKWFLRSPFTRWHNTSVHHNMHHRYVNYNYGLYFNIWDRLMGTNHPRYEQEFERVCGTSSGEDSTPGAVGGLVPEGGPQRL